MYISPPKDWWDAGDPSLPIRYGKSLGAACFLSLGSSKAQGRKIKQGSLERLLVASWHEPAQRGWNIS